MKEISNKLAFELLDMLIQVERICDDKGAGCSYPWETASQLLFDIRVHLSHHMHDMIEHPDFQQEAA